MKKVSLTWPDYLQMIDTLAVQIPWKKEKFERILAINRGGNIIGTILSHKTRIPLEVVEPRPLITGHRKLLLVDEIADSGETFKRVLGNLPKTISVKTAVLHKKYNTKFVPNYFVEESRHWIIYPYEQEIEIREETINGI